MQDFKVLSLKFNTQSTAAHTLFVRIHQIREKIPEKPPDRTLFIIGVPPYCSQVTLKELFSEFGTVLNVYLHKNPTAQLPPQNTSEVFPVHGPIEGFKVAYVVFEREKDLRKILKHKKPLILPQNSCITGVDKWLNHLKESVPDIRAMEAEIGQYMQHYDTSVDKKKKEDKNITEADEDGWMTVTKKGRRPGFARKESVKNQLTKRSEQQKKKKELPNFYRFQIRESKMKNLVALRQKFEEDKKKIAALKLERKFKPF